MAFNGSGVFTRLYNWANDAAASIKIRADRFDAEMDGFATGLSTCMTKDGQQLPTAAQNFNGQNLTNVGAFGSTGNNTFSGTTTLFSGTAARIQGDFSTATLANRTLFQDKTTNATTSVGAIPNGTGTSSQYAVWNNSDPTNASFGYLYVDAGAVQVGSSKAGSASYLPIQFLTNGTEAGRVTTSGAWGFGGTTVYNTLAGVLNAVGIASRNGTGGNCANNTMNLYWNGSATNLYVDGSNTGVVTVSSDYRIKKSVVTQTANAVARINALRPVLYEIADVEMFKGDGVVREGFIAHELAAVIPSSVDGVKDGLTSDGKIQPQTLRLDPIIAVLTKAVQELSARVAALEARP
jgi:hypothetical protein